VARVILYIWST